MCVYVCVDMKVCGSQYGEYGRYRYFLESLMSKEIMKKKKKNRKLGSRGIKLNRSVSAIFH